MSQDDTQPIPPNDPQREAPRDPRQPGDPYQPPQQPGEPWQPAATAPGWSADWSGSATGPSYERPADPYATPAAGGGSHGGGTGGGSSPVPAPEPRGRRPRRALAPLALVAVLAGLVGGGAGAATYAFTRDEPAAAVTSSLTAPQVSTAASTQQTFTSVEQVAKAVLPSVVSLEVSSSRGAGTGTGVILSSDGLILTNNHVAGAAGQGGSIVVTFNDGSTARASVVGLDPVTDLAVVKAKGVSGLQPAALGDSNDLKVGQEVVAIGSPLGLQGTVTSGIVSALDRPVRTGGEQSDQTTVIDAIQTDAAINPGNSGGPLVDMSGRVIGINSAIASLGATMGQQSGSIGLGFSIPVDQARNVAQQLEDSGKAQHALLGVSVGQERPGSTAVGALVASVNPGSAAEQAGLRTGDLITKVGDRRIDSSDALVAAIRSEKPGEQVSITYTRGGSSTTVTVTLGSDSGSAGR